MCKREKEREREKKKRERKRLHLKIIEIPDGQMSDKDNERRFFI